MATKKIYPIGVENGAMLFYNAEPADPMDVNPPMDGYIIYEGENTLHPVSLLALLTRPNSFKPFDDSPLAKLVIEAPASSADEWSKLLSDKNKTTIAKYTAQAPKPLKLPDGYSPEFDAALRSAGIAVEGPRRAVKRSKADPGELE